LSSADLTTLTEAAKYLGISRGKMCALVKKKVILFQRDPLDDRKKLIKISDLKRLKGASK
jgi:excisionase family DNA binding protein